MLYLFLVGFWLVFRAKSYISRSEQNLVEAQEKVHVTSEIQMMAKIWENLLQNASKNYLQDFLRHQ